MISWPEPAGPEVGAECDIGRVILSETDGGTGLGRCAACWGAGNRRRAAVSSSAARPREEGCAAAHSRHPAGSLGARAPRSQEPHMRFAALSSRSCSGPSPSQPAARTRLTPPPSRRRGRCRPSPTAGRPATRRPSTSGSKRPFEETLVNPCNGEDVHFVGEIVVQENHTGQLDPEGTCSTSTGR